MLALFDIDNKINKEIVYITDLFRSLFFRCL